MLPRQRATNSRKQQSSRNQLGRNDNGHSPSKMKKKLVNKMEENQKNYNQGKFSKNYSRVNSGEGREDQRQKGPQSRSIGKGDKGRKRSVDKKGSRGNLIGKKKGSKSSLSQNKRSRGGSQKNRKSKQKQNNIYQVIRNESAPRTCTRFPQNSQTKSKWKNQLRKRPSSRGTF